MNAIYYNRVENKIKLLPFSEAFSLRCAYVLSKYITITGNSYLYICFEKIFENAKLELKLKVLQGEAKHENDELNSLFSRISETIKMQRKIKHPTPRDILFLKKIEKTVDLFWKEYMEANLKKFAKFGLSQLEVFLASNEIKVMSVSVENPESDKDLYVPTSKILMLDFEDLEMKHFFFLPSIFFEDEYFGQFLPEELPLYYEPVFSFPNIIGFEADELKSLKLSCLNEALPFWDKFGVWYDACGEEQTDKSKQIFYDEVFPLTKNLNEKLNDSSFFKRHYHNSPIEIKYEVVMGEIPLQTIWAFYDKLGIIPDETKEELNTFRNNDLYKNKRIPFIANLVDITNILQEDKISEEIENESIVPPSRKTLNID